MNDKALLKEWLSGDKEAGNGLADRYRPSIRRICLRYYVPRTDLEDKMQTAYMVMYRAMPYYEGRNNCSLKTFVLTCIKNELREEKRKCNRRKRRDYFKSKSYDIPQIRFCLEYHLASLWRRVKRNELNRSIQE